MENFLAPSPTALGGGLATFLKAGTPLKQTSLGCSCLVHMRRDVLDIPVIFGARNYFKVGGWRWCRKSQKGAAVE